MDFLVWIILFLPLLAAVGIGLFALRNHELSARLSIGAIVAGFVLSLIVFAQRHDAAASVEYAASWLSVGGLQIGFGIRLDPLSLLMLLVVTGVGSAIHIYSYGYMREDPGMGRYFAGLSLFTFAMLGIVLATNFIQLFIFWELVGLSSYLLIGFWYERGAAADAAKKAFITNRLGDFGFLVGIILVWAGFGSVSFLELEEAVAANPNALGSLGALAGLLIFCGAMGKSAQFPLHVWLPDAMEGPTPVSALIHAATMVAAGVYMLCRIFFLFSIPQFWPEWLGWLQGITALDIVAWIGGLTALLAALIAVQQNDIKRILAYSTLSQLGYMIMAVGLGGTTPAMYHLATHASFKALLFLGAGSIIYALHHEQNIWKMGALRHRMPTTYWTFLVATLALCGVPPLSGFYSKDEILATASHQSVGLFVIASVVAFLTTFYMFRLFFVVFTGPGKSDIVEHAHESPKVMTWPLVALAVPTLLAGFWGIDALLNRHFNPGAAVAHHAWHENLFAPFSHAPLAAVIGLGALLFGFSFAYTLYAGARRDPLPERLGALSGLMRNRFYFDEIYARLIALTHELLARLADWLDRWIIAGLAVRGLHGTTEILGRALRLLQTGNLQTYALLFVLGAALVIWLVLGK